MAIPILSLPLELLQRIADDLYIIDLCQFRLSCRRVAKAIDGSFVKEFFTDKQFVLTDFSLQALVDISKTRLAKQLRFVHIIFDSASIDLFTGMAVESSEVNEFCYQYRTDQLAFSDRGGDQKLLAEAFKSLPNLEGIFLRSLGGPWPHRDGAFKRCSGYGVPTIHRLIHERVNPSKPYRSNEVAVNNAFPASVDRALMCLLSALGEAEARPKSIVLRLNLESHLPDSAFTVPQFQSALIDPVLEGLEKLHLCVTLEAFRVPPTALEEFVTFPPFQRLREFLWRAPNLQHIRINAQEGSGGAVSVLLRWLAGQRGLSPAYGMSYANLSRLPVSPPAARFCRWHRLEVISLGMMEVKTSDLLAVLDRFAPTLRRCELWKITLEPGTAGVPTLHRRCPIEWIFFLASFSCMPMPNLSSIMFGRLMEIKGKDRIYRRVLFDNRSDVLEHESTAGVPDWTKFFHDTVEGMKRI